MNDNPAFRVWLVTGASSGFGRAIAAAALERGDAVVAAARRLDALGELAELLRRLDRVGDARDAYRHALEWVHSDAERRFLEQRLTELDMGTAAKRAT